jgi:DNA polymerase-3 subunit alpha
MKLNAQQEAEQPQKPPAEAQMLRIVLRSTKDQARDMLHIRRIHGKVISYPGNDRFSFYIIEGNKGYLMEFPNDTTGITEELKNYLCEIVGVENVRVEPITYQ